jgi:uncharacterized NAD(P)/FAD-binding protein YdhS
MTGCSLDFGIIRVTLRSAEEMAYIAPRTIVIVGAGFSGTSVATNLLRAGHKQPVRVVLIDRSEIGRGVAYRRAKEAYLLNVPASRMSANVDDPDEFLKFAQRRLPGTRGEDFLPRELYGEYLESSLRRAENDAPPGVELQRMHGLVIAIERIPRTPIYQVHLDDGRTVRANDVVLALGNPSPAPLPGGEQLRGDARYLENPWQAPGSVRAGETVLLVGAGLTMADVAVVGLAGRKVVIHALSRHGLLPTAQTPFRHAQLEHDPQALLDAASTSLRSLCRAVRALVSEIESHHGDWREAISYVRELAPRLWQRLALSERRRFLRHVRCYWDVHRHRLPEGTWTKLKDLQREGRLHLHAARILRLEPAGKQIRVVYRPRGQSAVEKLLVDRVINCTGPDYNPVHTRERLLRSLLAQGLATGDALGLGLVTDEFDALVSASGHPANGLYYIGPMLRPAHWETTAVAELRQHAARLAGHLAEDPQSWTVKRAAWAPASRTSLSAGRASTSPSRYGLPA